MDAVIITTTCDQQSEQNCDTSAEKASVHVCESVTPTTTTDIEGQGLFVHSYSNICNLN